VFPRRWQEDGKVKGHSSILPRKWTKNLKRLTVLFEHSRSWSMRMFKRFLDDRRGGLTPAFAILLVPLLGVAGLAVDYGRAVYTKTALQAAADATALAVINPRYTTAQVKDAAKAIFEAELREKYNLEIPTSMEVTMAPDGKSVTVTVVGSVRNAFLQIIGKPATPVGVVSTGLRGLDNTLELALVLDNTGSMLADNKLPTLKSAATLLVDTLFADANAKVKIGVVPFSVYVNVGMGNRGAAWLSGSADYSTSSTTQSCTTPQTTCKTYTTTNVQSCVKVNCTTTQSCTTNDGVKTCKPVQSCQNQCTTTGTTQTCSVWNYGPQVCTPKTTTTNYKWSGCVQSRAYPLNLTDDTPTTAYPALMNQTCGSAIVPLTSSTATIKAAINGMTASGETYIPAGMVWGMNVLSPTAPFTEGDAFDGANRKPRKAIVLMTDGINTKSMTSTTVGTHTGTNTTQANDYTAKICVNAKAKNIEIYTIALMVNDAAVQTMLQACATSGENYFNATDTAALEAAFKKIALSLQTPYLGH
jgi:Flp pilus assembly protein TadG